MFDVPDPGASEGGGGSHGRDCGCSGGDFGITIGVFLQPPAFGLVTTTNALKFGEVEGKGSH